MKRPIIVFILVTYIITWGITIGSYVLHVIGTLTLNQLNLVYNLGALGPFAGAVVSARRYYGIKGVSKLFNSVKFKTISKSSLLISLSPAVFFLLGLLLYPVLAGHWYSFNDTKRQFNLTGGITYVTWLLPFITYSILEEFGWRGFLLPHLQQKFSALKSTFILTIIWASWHLPFFLWRFQFSWFITLGFFFSIFVGAIIITTTYNLSKGSIASVILFHLTNNITSALDKEYIVMVTSTCFVILAIYLLWYYKPLNLSDTERIKNFYG